MTISPLSGFRDNREKKLSRPTEFSTLDPSGRYKVLPVKRTFRLEDLGFSRTNSEAHFLAEIQLERELTGIPENQYSGNLSLCLSFICQQKEVSLLTSLIGREIEIEEERTVDSSKLEETLSELQRLREENKQLVEELSSLRHYLGTLQRPGRAS